MALTLINKYIIQFLKIIKTNNRTEEILTEKREKQKHWTLFVSGAITRKIEAHELTVTRQRKRETQ